MKTTIAENWNNLIQMGWLLMFAAAVLTTNRANAILEKGQEVLKLLAKAVEGVNVASRELRAQVETLRNEVTETRILLAVERGTQHERDTARDLGPGEANDLDTRGSKGRQSLTTGGAPVGTPPSTFVPPPRKTHIRAGETRSS